MAKKFVTLMAMTVLLVACAEHGMGQKEGAGTLVGAGVGALAGSQIGSGKGQLAAVAIGALLGAFAGKEIGKSLDKADRAALAGAAEKARTAPLKETISWSNPDSGNSGSVTAVREGKETTTGNYCREFRQTVTINGRTEEAYGRACRQPDGSWKIVS
ncbi:MAG: RT0821/Lpp0805 family surface protein [Pseudomonadota bacterium]|nr:RT0821/Lpp0805 family surface protein [Pseudomonadota bacterium]